jgi:hypothetical protein
MVDADDLKVHAVVTGVRHVVIESGGVFVAVAIAGTFVAEDL